MAARLAPQKSSPDGTVKKRVGRRRFVQANSPARSGLHQTLADAEVIPQTEPKAVLEHRAPKTSPPILHSRGLESKAGRVPRVRDAPPSVHPERSGGQGTARPTRDRPLAKQNPPISLWFQFPSIRTKFILEGRVSPRPVSAARHSSGAVNSGLKDEPSSARAAVRGFAPHQTLDGAEVVPPTEPKAVLEHRAPNRPDRRRTQTPGVVTKHEPPT